MDCGRKIFLDALVLCMSYIWLYCTISYSENLEKNNMLLLKSNQTFTADSPRWRPCWWRHLPMSDIQGCQPVRNFRILYGFYMQNTGVRIWPTKYGNWALSVLSLKVLLSEQNLPVLDSKSVRICGILCLKTFKYLFNHQNIQSSLFYMW